MFNVKRFASLVLLTTVVVCVSGKPYWQDLPAQPRPAIPASVAAAANAAEQIQQQAQMSPQNTGSGPLHERIHGHMNQLLSHGGSAIMGAVEKVQPDLKNIGKDFSDALQVTRTNVGKRIEPLAQTVRPYLDHAQKVVAPIVSQAREEVPKLINQAGPKISNLGEQVRTGLSGVWGKLTSVASQATQGVQNAAQSLGQNGQNGLNQIQQAGDQLQKSATDAVQKPAETAQQVTGNIAQ